MPRDVQDAEQSEEASPFCEVLGPRQRRWLDQVLSGSRAPLKVIASGSVLFGSTGLGENAAENDWQGRCSGGCHAPWGRGLPLGFGGPGLGRYVCTVGAQAVNYPHGSVETVRRRQCTHHQPLALPAGDDWDCYRPAQLSLLQTLQRHAAESGGCYILLTGDYHARCLAACLSVLSICGSSRRVVWAGWAGLP